MFGVFRTAVPSAWLVVLLTWPVGIGMGLGNALAPIAVKEHFGDRPATGDGCLYDWHPVRLDRAAALAVPLAGVARRLAGALIAFSCVALGSLVAWVVLTRGESPTPAGGVSRGRRARADRVAARRDLLADGSAYYGLNAWLPDAYTSAAGATGAPGCCSRR